MKNTQKEAFRSERSPTKTTEKRTEPYKMLKRTTKPLSSRVLTEEGLAKSSKKQHSENTDKWHLCKAGSFSYGESPWTPPLEGTSLHRWNNSVERPWGILSLFTTCLPWWVKSPCHRLWHVDYTQKTHQEERNTRECQPEPQKELGTRSCMKNHKKINQRKYSEVKEPLFTIVHEITLPQAVTCGLPPKSTLRREKH